MNDKCSAILGAFGVLPVVPLVSLPLVLLVAIGTTDPLRTPQESWLPLATFLLVVNNESRSSFATALLQQQNINDNDNNNTNKKRFTSFCPQYLSSNFRFSSVEF